MKKLSNATLHDLDSKVTVPTYNRADIGAGFVHIGVGGFHRAHQAVYLDDLLQQGVRGWGICGVGLLPQDRRMLDALTPQDDLYTVVRRSASGNRARVIGSHSRYLLAPADPEAVLTTLASPQTHIVTLTITEGGYGIKQDSGEFDSGRADVVHDLSHPAHPVSVFGYLSEALRRRHAAGTAPFTLLSCDNLPHNGDVARNAVTAFTRLQDPALADWIEANAAFPNCMVDRITPQTTEADRQAIRDEFGIDDAWPVVCEPFRQWVVEDRFSDGRPPLEDVGVQFTDDVRPYEMMKIRLLNAGHSAIGYLGALMGYSYIADVMADPLFQTFLTRLMDEEITPLLAPVPGIDLPDYKRTLRTRFANPTIRDQVARICLDGSSKMPKFLLPSLKEQLARGGPCDLLCLAVAGWFRYLAGTDERGQPIQIEDPMAQRLQELARAGGTDPRPLLSLTELFGDLRDAQAFVAQLSADLHNLYASGARTTLVQALGSSGTT